MQKVYFLFAILCSGFSVFAQSTVVIKGKVLDKATQVRTDEKLALKTNCTQRVILKFFF